YAFSAASAQPDGGRFRWKRLADYPQRPGGRGARRGPDGDARVGADGLSSAGSADEPWLRAPRRRAEGRPAVAGGRGDAESVGRGAPVIQQRGAAAGWLGRPGISQIAPADLRRFR